MSDESARCEACGRLTNRELRVHECPMCKQRDLIRHRGDDRLFWHNENGVSAETAEAHICGAPPEAPLLDHGDRRIAPYEPGDALESEPTIESATGPTDPLASAVFDALRPYLGSLVTEDSIEPVIARAMKKFNPPMPVLTVKVAPPSMPEFDAGVQHAEFATLVRLMGARLNAYLHGPAGSGKTRTVQEAAKALGLAFYPKSVGPATMEHTLLGHLDVESKLVRTPLREAFEHGGVCILDEIDAANPAAITVLNSAMANGYCAFPDGIIEKHPDCVLVASGNTTGQGGDRMYTRGQLDAATLDRFMFVSFEHDTTIEAMIASSFMAAIDPDAGAIRPPKPQKSRYGATDGEAGSVLAERIRTWTQRVWAIRKAVESLDVRMIVSTRAIEDGARAIAAGFDLEAVEDMKIFGPFDKATRDRVLSNV